MNKSADITYAELLKSNRSSPPHSWTATVAVLQNIHMEPYLQDSLNYYLIACGGNAVCRFSGIASYHQDCAKILPDADYTLVCLDLERLSPVMAKTYGSANETEKKEMLNAITAQLHLLAEQIGCNTSCPLFWLGFHNQYEISGGNLLSGNEWNEAVAELNKSIRALLRPNWFFIDMNSLIFKRGSDHFFDRKLSFVADIPYRFGGCLAIAQMIERYIRACRGLAKKCIVLDCDNTLWGGILSEDGLERICLGELSGGKAYQDFQRELLKFWQNGILLALCSKNDAEEVWKVFDHHPNMLLKRSHIAAAQINWDAKSENLRRLSAALGIGLSSMVLMDDNPAECLEVSLVLPEVTVLPLDAGKPYLHAEALRECGLFDRLQSTDEDKLRNSFYQDEQKRQSVSGAAERTEEFLRTLSTVLTISAVNDHDLARVLQLSSRANRLNAAGGAISEESLRTADCFCLRATDQFGELGLIGFALIRKSVDGQQVPPTIEAFTISCRALGRKIEDAFLEWCVSFAIGGNALTNDLEEDAVCFQYLPTSRNQMILQLLEQHGFLYEKGVWVRKKGFPVSTYPIEIQQLN